MTNSLDETYSGRSNTSIAVSKAREKKYHAQRPGLMHSVWRPDNADLESMREAHRESTFQG